MTLTEARKILGDYHPHEKKVREALKTAIAVLPKDEPKPACDERLQYYISLIQDNKGFNPFQNRSRNVNAVAWRRTVFLRLRQENYTLHEIGRATGYDHSTIISACKSLEDYLTIGDPTTTRIWKQFLTITNQ